MRRLVTFGKLGAVGLYLATTDPATAQDAAQAQDILVTGERPASESTTGTKTATPIAETPQSVSVVSAAELSVRNVQNLNAALEYTAGITPSSRGANADVFDQFKLRGFDVSQYLDGLRLTSGQSGLALPQPDISLIDRIDILKGSASALYGQASPGGLVALTSKRPLERSWYGGVAATGGSFNLYRFDADLGGRAGRNILYRVYGSVNGADTQQTFGKRRRYTGSAAITLGSGGPTTLTVIGNYSHDPFNGNYGEVPRLGSLAPNPNGRIPTDFADGEPSSRISRDQGSITYLLDQSLGGAWAFHDRGRYLYDKLDLDLTATFGIPSNRSLAVFGRTHGDTTEKLNNYTFDNQITGAAQTGLLTHTLLFGVETQFARVTRETRPSGPGVPPINPFNPVYGLPLPPTQLSSAADNHQRQIGVYAQDQIALGDFLLTATGRHDWVRSDLTERFMATDQSKRDRRFTWRVGGLYKVPFGVSPYVSYATSFQPQLGAVLPNGSIADPSYGHQLEAGAKYQPKGTDILLSAAWFDIVQSNVVYTNPITRISTQSGRVKSQGFELEAKVPVYRGLLLTTNYGRQKVRDVRDDNLLAVGNPLIGSTRDGGGAFARYTVQHGPLEGLGIGGGARYVGRGYGGCVFSPTRIAVPTYVPSYTLFDATLAYDLGHADRRLAGLTAQVNANNIGNKRYISSCSLMTVDWCWYGSRRTILGTLAYRW